MSIVVRDVREHELDSVLALNNAAGPAILPLDATRLRHFFDHAEYFRVAERDGTLAGFLIGMGSGSQHDSSNFRWFRERYPEFFYIDRIVVASRRRGGGVGRAFYADAQSYAEVRYPHMACAVFLDGTNDPVLLFHGKSRAAVASFCLDLFRGVHTRRTDVEIRPVQEVVFEGPEEAYVQIDGDVVLDPHPVRVRLHERPLMALVAAP